MKRKNVKKPSMKKNGALNEVLSKKNEDVPIEKGALKIGKNKVQK